MKRKTVRPVAAAALCLALAGCAPLATRTADPSWARAPVMVTDPESGIPYLKQQVFVRSGADDIASVFLSPVSKPFAGMVWLAGSRDGLPSPEGPLARKLVTRGTAVLLLGKKGVGASGGDWRRETFEDRAANAQAALDWLARHPDVDPKRIGVYGHSQGAYIAAMVAARGSGPSYAVLAAGPAQAVRDQIATDYTYRRMRDEGLDGTSARDAGRIYTFVLDAAMSLCPLARVHYLCGIYRFDPVQHLQSVRVPVLALYGERDTLVPPDENLARMRAALAKSGAPYAIKVLPEANHQFWKSVRGTASEQIELGRPEPARFVYAQPGNPIHEQARLLRANRVEYAEGYFESVLGFVTSNGRQFPLR